MSNSINLELEQVTHKVEVKSESLIGLFEESVRLYPTKTAIYHNDQSISYDELNSQANAIADSLLDLGIKEGSIVAILMERSINLIAAMLGVLKSGAAYVVIDADYPIARIEYILQDTRANLLITAKAFEYELKYKDIWSYEGCKYVYISELLLDPESHTINPVLQTNGDSLACIIYTSGSTGKPKGVLLNHKSFYRLFNGPDMVQTSSSDSVAQIANASFDVAVHEIWAALGQGGSLVIIDKKIVLSPESLEECLKQYKVTTILLTVGLLNELVKIKPNIFKSIKNVLFGGEAANPQIIRMMLNNNEFRCPKLFNLYGPTECGINATYYEIKTLADDAISVPIGVPVNETQVYVLNDDLEKVQPGEVGELYLSGDGVARGYLNLPELTAERFITCPFDRDHKMYKTGDMVKTRPDGIIDFVGRKDNQVKVRGFRIELEEVECALNSYPDILQCIVVAPYTPEGYRQLIAYCLAKDQKSKIGIEAVSLHLKKILPDYMIPGILIQVDSLPLNAHGKIDRQTLSNNMTIGSGSLISLFEKNVQSTPNKIAIFHNDQTISYGDLNCQANAIADRLFKLGIKEGSIVTILLERSINLVASILGVLKTGAAYVVIDPNYPTSRIEYILKDTNCPILLTDEMYETESKYKDLLKSRHRQHLYISELLVDAISHTTNPFIQSKGDTLACILYTSGSTGQPKGVLLNHQSFYRLFNGPDMVQTSSSDYVSQTANASFDAAIYETWAALGKGASLVIIDNDIVLSPKALEGCFKKYNITTAFLTTGLFNQLAKITPSIFKSLKNALCAGEAANAEIIRTILNSEFRPQRLYNLYGPTECAVFATYYEIKMLDNNATSVPIGVPVNATQVYILNNDLKKVQPGEIGELYIGGESVARGYLNLPDLTAERFITCPFDRDSKMYKTGDLVKTLPNGIIDFVGRKDNQVKIRGFRVELEEVECALESYRDVWQGVVIAPYTPQGHRQLVAYFTSKNSKSKIDIDCIRAHLKKALPDYMIPGIIIQLDFLPLSSHGKIDRNALSNIRLNQTIEDIEEPLDLTTSERLLLEIWRNILRLDNLKLTDNFFNLGGDSIMIMQMISQAANYGITLKHSLILQHPTIKSLTALIQGQEIVEEDVATMHSNLSRKCDERCSDDAACRDSTIDISLTEYSSQELTEIVLDIDNVQAIYPLIPIQEGLLFHAIHDAKSHAYFIQTHWRCKGKYNAQAMREAWEILMQNHELLRASFLWENVDYPIQIIHKKSKIAFLEQDWRVFLPEEQERKLNEYFSQDCELGVDFKKPPFMRFVTIQMSDNEQMMIWSFHHIIMDGPSLFNIIAELDYYYSTLCSGNKVVLKPKPLFRDYIVWQKQQNQDINKFFWEDYLKEFILPNQILFQQNFHLDNLSSVSCHMLLDYELSEELSQSLHKYAKDNRLTLNGVMEGIWAYLMSIYCHTLDVVFGLTISIRPPGIKNIN
ncbi:MAG: hypothetical protein C5B43_03560, partial [Verrucomicrobia bacterium]